MVFSNSHPIQVRIIISWKKGYNGVKREFENALKAGCNIYSGRKRKGLLKFFNIETDFYDEYDIVGKTQGVASQQSYILKDKLSGASRTQFSLFNNQKNIKKEIKHIKEIYKKTLEENPNVGRLKSRVCCWEENFSIKGSVGFNKNTFKGVLKENLYLLLGWFIAPAIKIANIYSATEKNLNTGGIDLPEAVETLQKIVNNTTGLEVAVSVILISLFYFLVSFIKWKQNQNVIRI